MQKQSDEKRYLLQSVYNALRILDLLSVRDSLGIAEISRITELDKTSVFKIMYTLQHRDYVFKTADAKYKLGVKFSNYGDIVNERRNLSEIAAPTMRQLSNEMDCTTLLGVLNANGRVIVMHRESGPNEKYTLARLGSELDAHTTAMGKILLAHLDPDILQNIVERLRLPRFTAHTIQSKEKLLKVLEECKGAQYAEDVDERQEGIGGMAVPIFEYGGGCVASLSIVARTTVIQARRDEFKGGLTAQGHMMSRGLGFFEQETGNEGA